VQPVRADRSEASGTPQTTNLVFPITVVLDEPSIRVDGRLAALGPGMTVNVEIKTGDRPLIQYLLAPLVEVASEAGHER
jgi:hemolysin D